MRLTTKIIIGVVLSIFMLSLFHIIFFSFTKRRYYERKNLEVSMMISQVEKDSLATDAYRVIVIEAESIDEKNVYYAILNNDQCGLLINPAKNADEKNKLIFPKELSRFISTTTNLDTLTVKIKTNEMIKNYLETHDIVTKTDNVRYILNYVYFSGFNLFLNTSNVNVINKVADLQTKIDSLETDTIKVLSDGKIDITLCKADYIEPALIRRHQPITLTKCTIKKLYCDLDQIGRWNTVTCDIEETYFTGTNNMSASYDNKERGTIKWRPKTKDAEITLKFKGDISVKVQE